MANEGGPSGNGDSGWRWMLKAALAVVGILGALAAIFVVSWRLTIGATAVPENYELPQLLLTATSVALLFWSLFLAALVFIGWRRIRAVIAEQARRAVEKEAEQVEEEFERVRSDIRGKVHLIAGIIYGRLSSITTEDELRVGDEEYLSLAINHLQTSTGLLEGQEGEVLAKNSLAFAYALSESTEYGLPARDLALGLREHAVHSTHPAHLNTYARVVAAYPSYFKEPDEAIREAREVLKSMMENPDVSDREKQNARRHLTALDRALEEKVEAGSD